MREISKGILEWSWFSQEKAIDFNGHLLMENGEGCLIDPPSFSLQEQEILQKKKFHAILITNRDHVREAELSRTLFKAPVMGPEADAPFVDIKVDQTFRDGDRLPGGIEVISIHHGKSPGESALWFPGSGGVLVLGDALIGKPKGELNLLPAEKFSDRKRAIDGLRVFLRFDFEMVLVGDGESVLRNGKKAVENFFAREGFDV
ncbi:MAG TPA: hypothetical protein VGB26_09910 [Nitrospiria bacterium]